MKIAFNDKLQKELVINLLRTGLNKFTNSAAFNGECHLSLTAGSVKRGPGSSCI